MEPTKEIEGLVMRMVAQQKADPTETLGDYKARMREIMRKYRPLGMIPEGQEHVEYLRKLSQEERLSLIKLLHSLAATAQMWQDRYDERMKSATDEHHRQLYAGVKTSTAALKLKFYRAASLVIHFVVEFARTNVSGSDPRINARANKTSGLTFF